VKLNQKFSQYSSHTKKILKYYVEKATETAIQLVGVGDWRNHESAVALSMMKTLEEDINS